MVQRIEEIYSQLKAATFLGPADRDVAHDAQVNVELARAVRDPGRAVSEGGSDAVGAATTGPAITYPS